RRALRVPLLPAAGVRDAASVRGFRPHPDLWRHLSVAQGCALDRQVINSHPTGGVSDMSWTRLFTIVLPLASLGAGPAAAQTVLRIGLNDDPDALDPTVSRAYVGRLVFAAFCDKLFDVTPDLKIVPQLATSYEWAANGRSVVIKLRPGVKFHDGEPFNAEAVRFNIDRHLHTPGSFRKSEIGEIKSVDVVNDLTVRLNLSEPLVPLIAALTDRAGMMISPKAARELGDKFGTRPVCAGPQNDSKYCNQDVDALLLKARHVADPAERK